jgi:hypothetical protein
MCTRISLLFSWTFLSHFLIVSVNPLFMSTLDICQSFADWVSVHPLFNSGHLSVIG